MTDKELLELAAKAAGIVGEYVSDYWSGNYYYQGNTEGICYELSGGGLVVWNPLTNDGDALRLAVKLDLLIDGAFAACEKEEYAADPYAATRRAILRAAAEIGKELK